MSWVSTRSDTWRPYSYAQTKQKRGLNNVGQVNPKDCYLSRKDSGLQGGDIQVVHASPSVSAGCSEPTQEGRSPACRVASRRGRPNDLFNDTTDLLSGRISTWCPRMSGRKN